MLTILDAVQVSAQAKEITLLLGCSSILRSLAKFEVIYLSLASPHKPEYSSAECHSYRLFGNHTTAGAI